MTVPRAASPLGSSQIQARRIEDFVERHGADLLAACRRHSANAADADDVFQRTIEALLTKAPADADDMRLRRWTLAVAKNEAMNDHRHRSRFAHQPIEESAADLAAPTSNGHDRSIEREDAEIAGEALRRIKPDQLRCLLLRADGSDYVEIQRITGFSYTKVNRCISDGRKAALGHVRRLEQGSECARIEGFLSLVADGEAVLGERPDVANHVDHCLHCRATLRQYVTTPDRLAAAIPLALATIDLAREQSRMFGKVAEAVQSAYVSLQQRIAAHLPDVVQSRELVTLKRATVTLACGASIVAGGVTAEHESDGETRRPVRGDVELHSRSAEQVAKLDDRQPVRTNRRAGAERRTRYLAERDVLPAAAGSYVSESDESTDPPGRSLPARDSAALAAPADDPSPGGSSDAAPELAP